jgi:hypothetical protein
MRTLSVVPRTSSSPSCLPRLPTMIIPWPGPHTTTSWEEVGPRNTQSSPVPITESRMRTWLERPFMLLLSAGALMQRRKFKWKSESRLQQ